MSIGMLLNWMNWTASDAARLLDFCFMLFLFLLHVLWYIDRPYVVSADGIRI